MIQVFDQGFASAFWLGVVLAYGLRFVLRWRKDYQLLDAVGNRRLTWKIAQGKRGWSQRWVWDARRARLRWWPLCWCSRSLILTILNDPCGW